MKMMKKIFKGLLASVIIFLVGTIIASAINLLAHISPVLFVIFFIIVLFYEGYYFANEIFTK